MKCWKHLKIDQSFPGRETECVAIANCTPSYCPKRSELICGETSGSGNSEAWFSRIQYSNLCWSPHQLMVKIDGSPKFPPLTFIISAEAGLENYVYIPIQESEPNLTGFRVNWTDYEELGTFAMLCISCPSSRWVQLLSPNCL